MLPLLGAAVGTAAAQYYTSEQARKQNQKLLDEQRAMLNGVPLPELSEADYYGDGVSNQIDPSAINYDQYQYQGDYNPYQAAYDQEVNPTTIQESTNAKFGRDAQVEALKKFQQNIASGYDPEFAARMDQANQSSQANAQSRSASILQDAQRRGQFGSNASLAAQLQHSSDAMSEGARASQLAAVESQKNLLQQQRDAATMGGSLARDENSLAAQNADIVNSFNQRSSRAHQQYLNQAAELQNQAQMRNLNTRQNMSGQNTDLANKQQADRLRLQQSERAYQNQLVGNRNKVKQDNFNNQITRVTGNQAANTAQMGMNNDSAMAQNNAIQGVGQGFGGYFQTQDASANRADDRKFQADEAAKERAAKYGA